MFVDLTQYLWILWLALVVLFVVIELVTLEFTFLMIAAGCLIGGLGSNLLGWEWWVQIGLAAIISALLIFTIRPLLLLTLRKGGDPALSNVEALYGQGARVMTDFIEGNGVVKLDNGETWTSRLAPIASGATLVEGDRVVVTQIDGAIAVVALPGSIAAIPEPPLPAPAT
ncbi:MAG: NfeD family protein [Salinibacterium sp.]|nr:NfeD family protein [Salinibacterium sp.]